MASKENQRCIDQIKSIISHPIPDMAMAREFIIDYLNKLQQAIDELEIKDKALEKACDMVSFYEGMDYRYFVEKYVNEAKKDIKELEELENGK